MTKQAHLNQTQFQPENKHGKHGKPEYNNVSFITNVLLGLSTGYAVWLETGFISLSMSMALILFMVLLQFDSLKMESKIRNLDLYTTNEMMASIHHDLHNHTHRLKPQEPQEEPNETKHT